MAVDGPQTEVSSNGAPNSGTEVTPAAEAPDTSGKMTRAQEAAMLASDPSARGGPDHVSYADDNSDRAGKIVEEIRTEGMPQQTQPLREKAVDTGDVAGAIHGAGMDQLRVNAAANEKLNPAVEKITFSSRAINAVKRFIPGKRNPPQTQPEPQS